MFTAMSCNINSTPYPVLSWRLLLTLTIASVWLAVGIVLRMCSADVSINMLTLYRLKIKKQAKNQKCILLRNAEGDDARIRTIYDAHKLYKIVSYAILVAIIGKDNAFLAKQPIYMRTIRESLIAVGFGVILYVFAEGILASGCTTSSYGTDNMTALCKFSKVIEIFVLCEMITASVATFFLVAIINVCVAVNAPIIHTPNNENYIVEADFMKGFSLHDGCLDMDTLIAATISEPWRESIMQNRNTIGANNALSEIDRIMQTNTTRPDTTRSEDIRPENIRPDTTRSENIRPEDIRPDTTCPDTTRPNTGIVEKKEPLLTENRIKLTRNINYKVGSIDDKVLTGVVLQVFILNVTSIITVATVPRCIDDSTGLVDAMIFGVLGVLLASAAVSIFGIITLLLHIRFFNSLCKEVQNFHNTEYKNSTGIWESVRAIQWWRLWTNKVDNITKVSWPDSGIVGIYKMYNNAASGQYDSKFSNITVELGHGYTIVYWNRILKQIYDSAKNHYEIRYIDLTIADVHDDQVQATLIDILKHESIWAAITLENIIKYMRDVSSISDTESASSHTSQLPQDSDTEPLVAQV